jgi:hypothetical protein
MRFFCCGFSKNSVFKYAFFLLSDDAAGEFSTGVFKYAFFLHQSTVHPPSVCKFSAFLKIDFFCCGVWGILSHLLCIRESVAPAPLSSVSLSVAFCEDFLPWKYCDMGKKKTAHRASVGLWRSVENGHKKRGGLLRLSIIRTGLLFRLRSLRGFSLRDFRLPEPVPNSFCRGQSGESFYRGK